MKSNRSLYQLAVSMPDTSVKGCGFWATPTTRDHKDTPGMSPTSVDGRNRVDQLARQVYHRDGEAGGLLNPYWVEVLMGYPMGWTDLT